MPGFTNRSTVRLADYQGLAMRYRILGPLEIRRDDGRLVQLTGPRPERAMAALLLEANRVVSVERLIDVLWDEDPPRGAVKQVSNCVSMIRAAFADSGSPSPVARSGSGYRLAVRDRDADVLVFRTLLDEAAQQWRDGTLEVAAGTLREALSLWRGQVLSGMRSEALEPAAAHLAEERLRALDQLAELELQLGRHQDRAADRTRGGASAARAGDCASHARAVPLRAAR